MFGATLIILLLIHNFLSGNRIVGYRAMIPKLLSQGDITSYKNISRRESPKDGGKRGRPADFDPSVPYSKCDPRGNPCKDGLIFPMWRPGISQMQEELYALTHSDQRQLSNSPNSRGNFRFKGRNNGFANILDMNRLLPSRSMNRFEADQRIRKLRRRIKVQRVIRGITYFAGLVYLFIGVSIIADRFMAAIEVITSKERDVAVKRSVANPLAGDPYAALLLPRSHQPKARHEITIVTVRIWNETVSNLTLMALGSSAPEILLSIIEVMGKNFEAGELGPGTIVGSAAFNLFIIVGLCILVVPRNESRKIRYLRVFFLTASWSIFAYIWLYLILAVISPGRVTVAEGLITFAFFPLTVLTAYIVDVQMYKRWWTVSKRYGAKYKNRASIVYVDGDNRNEFISLPDLTITEGNVISGHDYGRSFGRSSESRESTSLLSRLSFIPPNLAAGETTAEAPPLTPRKISLVIDGTRRTLPLYDFSDTTADTGINETASRKSLVVGRKSPAPSATNKFFRRKSTLVNITLPFLKSECDNVPIQDNLDVREGKIPTSESVNTAMSALDDRAYRDYVEFEKTRQAYMKALSDAKAKHPDADIQTLEGLASYEVLNKGPKSRAYYRIQATRKLLTKQGNVMGKDRIRKISSRLFNAGNKKSSRQLEAKYQKGSNQQSTERSLVTTSPTSIKQAVEVARVYFDPGHYTIMENAGKCQLRVVRVGGNLESVIKVDYETRDGTAKANDDYGPTKGTLVFEKGKIEAFLHVPIVDDDEFEPDEYFYVDLRHLRFASDDDLPSPNYASSESPDMSKTDSKDLEVRLSSPENDESWYSRIKRSIGKSPSSTLTSTNKTATLLRTKRVNPLLQFDNPRTATVMIFDDDHAGTFCFETESLKCNENCGLVNVKVLRKSGGRGKVYVPYETSDITARGVDPDDFESNYHEIDTSTKIKSPHNVRNNSLSKPGGLLRNFSSSFKRRPKNPETDKSTNKNAQLPYTQDPYYGSSVDKKEDTLQSSQISRQPLLTRTEPTDGLIASTKHTATNYSSSLKSENGPNNKVKLDETREPLEIVEQDVKPRDYVRSKGYLVFEDEQLESFITLRIIDTEQYEKLCNFVVKLGQPIWAKRDKDEDSVNPVNLPDPPRPSLFEPPKAEPNIMGSPELSEPNVCTVTIVESKDFKLTIDKLLKKTNMALLVGTCSWKDQFIDAFTVQGSGEDGDGEDGAVTKGPTWWDYTLHFITLFWKVLFAFVPPTDIWGGWCCFVFAIIWIGILTAVIGDLAASFGCTIGLKDSVTAISFVALGTSVPDTFASKVAATQDEYADASIGNVTGSNAVNVFLGIGIAWALCAIYHAIKGTTFYVDPGSLAFSVTVYCVLAVVAIGVLMVKRIITKAELGGPIVCKIITSSIFILFWFIYLILASLESYCKIKGF